MFQSSVKTEAQAIVITSISPSLSTTAGGTVVTITGSNFTSPISTLQEMTPEYCADMPVYPVAGSTISLTDSRDGQEYRVRKLADNNCWFIDNLKLELVDGMTLTPSDTDVGSNTTVSLAAGGLTANFTTSGYLTADNTDSSGNNYDNYNAWRQVDPSSAIGCKDNLGFDYFDHDELAYNTNSKTGCGYLYNFYTAAAGTASNTVTSGTASGSICPAGWRLPTLDNSSGGFGQLDAAYGGADLTGGEFHYLPQSAQVSSLWSYDGIWQGTTVTSLDYTSRGIFGLYWPSSIRSASTVYSMIVAYDVQFPDAATMQGLRYAAQTVRCVALGGSASVSPPVPTVTFGGVTATNVSIVDNDDSTQTITATAPAHAAGAVNVTVNNNVVGHTLTNGFLYYDEVEITKIEPDHGFTDGGTTVAITGKNFEVPTLSSPETMQQMTQSYCESMLVYDSNNPTAGGEIILPDSRNGQSYTIRKLADNNCWMVNNLRISLADVGNNPSASDPNINTAALVGANAPDNSNPTTYTAPKYYDPTCGAINAPAAPGCGNTDITSDHFYGFLYNWCAALGATTGACTGGGIYPSDLSGNAMNSGNYDAADTASICPAGWHLPSGGATGEFAYLNGMMAENGTYSVLTDSAHAVNWGFAKPFRGVLSGHYMDGSFALQNSRANLLSASAFLGDPYSVSIAHFYSSLVHPGTGAGNRDGGFAVRCLAAGGAYAPPPAPIVEFGGVAATVKSFTDTEIVVETPLHAAGAVDVVVTNGVSSDTLAAGYTYIAPYIEVSSDTDNLQIGGGAIAPSPSGVFAFSPNAVSVKTNLDGYKLTISTNSTSNTLNHAALAGVGIAATGGTWATKSVLSNNTWGFTLSSSPGFDQPIWAAVPNVSSPLQIKSTSVPNETSQGDQTVVNFGTKVDLTMPAGKYQTTVVYTVEANI
jgi:uncharacterized protein (TIGR02145 family)